MDSSANAMYYFIYENIVHNHTVLYGRNLGNPTLLVKGNGLQIFNLSG